MGPHTHGMVAMSDASLRCDLGNGRTSITFKFERGGVFRPADLRPLLES